MRASDADETDDPASLGAGRLDAAETLAEAQREVAQRAAEAGRLQRLIDQAAMIVRATDTSGASIFLSPAWEQHTGQSVRDGLGHGWLDCVHPDDRLATSELLARSRHQHESYAVEYRLRRPDGTYRWVMESGAPRFAPDGAFLGKTGSFVEIDDRNGLEKERERLLALARRTAGQLQALAAASVSITQAPDLERTLAVVNERARLIVGAHQAVTSIHGDGETAHVIGAVDLSDRYAVWRDYAEAPDGSGIYSLVLRSGRPLRLTHEALLAHPLWRAFGSAAERHPPLRGLLAVPLLGREGRAIGLLQLSDKEQGEFTAEDEAILVQLAHYGAAAIEKAEANQALRLAAERTSLALAAGRMGTWEWDAAARRMVVSDELALLLGLPGGADSDRPVGLEDHVLAEDRPLLQAWIERVLEIGQEHEIELRVRHGAGAIQWIQVRVMVVRAEDGTASRLVGVAMDTTERRLNEARIRELAERDALTGLPNRRLLHSRLERAVTLCRQRETLGALMLFDLDGFKDVNDSLGHDAGDALLREVGRRLQLGLRELDTVARIGGDEFAVILGHLLEPDDAAVIAQRLLGHLERPFVHLGQEIHTGASVGITLLPVDATDPGHLLKNADIALYEAKANRRHGWAYFDAELRARIERRRLLEAELRRGLVAGELSIFYQPVLRLADAAITGFEALLRWHHPTRGLLGPSDFLRVAEETGLIVQLGAFALRRATLQAKAWLEAGLDPGTVIVNLAPSQFLQGNLAPIIEAALAEACLPAARLEVEVTEGVFLGRSIGTVVGTLDRLHGLGIAVSFDDFGTGFASLAHLKRFPIDRIKIDRSFVRDMTNEPEDAAIVRAMVGLGRSLGMTVIAEGVETIEQLQALQAIGCDAIQGYLVSPAVAAHEVPKLLASNEWRERIMQAVP